MILITGATGKIGSHVLRQLTERRAEVRVMARDPATVRTTAEVVRGDFEDASSLPRAVDGVEAVFLVTTPRKPVVDHDVAMVDAARAAGVRRIVKLSAISVGPTWHLAVEDVITTSGMEWTILKPSSFAANLLQFADAIRAGDPLPDWTGPGALGVIDPRDVAAVAVEALTTKDHIGQSYTLTGPELLTFSQQIAIVRRVLGRPVTSVDVPLDAVRAMMIQNGMDPAAVEASVTGMRQTVAGDYAILTDAVAGVLGRPPTSFETWVRDHRDLFGQPGTHDPDSAPAATD
ncbi:MAG: NAD(P)H-binding protein [Kibdelosporangium sp.]